ncbi:DnaD domain-containing protein [Streptococcus gallolyticus]|uniref:DnaD and phage-associated domain-containing protein n=1 Tax=Streptococcus gallolyticus TaxID=315405 RepID=A0A1H9V709_9STRE|nr:DnaD domain protein [Streptococcus gallolyticus]SES17349.1 DnaD and phage-associated domain-containing protein [Streptococcus gallolyticus]
MTKAELFDNLHQCFGRFLTPFEIVDINEWINDGLPPEVINEALKEAVLENKINFKYINTILRRYVKVGIDTLEKVELDRKQHELSKNNFKQHSNNDSVGFGIQGSGY